MSVVSEARGYVDSAVESSKATLSTVVEKLQALPTDAKQSAASVGDDAKNIASSALKLARRNSHAWIGASDAILASWTRRADTVQEELKKNASKLVGDTRSRTFDAGELVESVSATGQMLAEKAQKRIAAIAEDVKDFSTKAVESARQADYEDVKSSTRQVVDARFTQIVNTFNELADRGEKVVTDLREKKPVQASTKPATKSPTKPAAATTRRADTIVKRAATNTRSTAKTATSDTKATASKTASGTKATASKTASGTKATAKKAAAS